MGGIALTQKGVCRVVNLSKSGVSLKCFSELEFPNEFTIDIYDETGLDLQELKVKKVWEKRPSSLLQSELEFGGSFENLSTSQEVQLYSYLMQRMLVDPTAPIQK